MSDKLEFTGERFTPECVREIRYEHIHRYAFAQEFVQGLRVLDAACGEGYGSALLAHTADSVVGLDISEEAIGHARQRYASENLKFRQGDCTDLPFDDDEFDCVISFETLEHLENQQGLLQSFRRVLKPGGFLLVSTPDKAVYTDQQGNRNEYHVSELYRGEFEELLADYFPAVRLWGQKLGFQSSLWALDGEEGVSLLQETDAGISRSSSPQHEAVYLLAFCAADEDSLPATGSGLSLFDDADETVYEHYYHEIRKHIAAGLLLQQRDAEIDRLKSELKKATLPSWKRWLGRS